MSVRRRIVGKSSDGRRMYAISGDDLPWRYDVREDVFFVTSKDGRARYAVGRTRPTGLDRGRLPYPYWRAVVLLDDKMMDLGEHMIAWEGKEVCQIYESSRLDALTEGKKIDDSRG